MDNFFVDDTLNHHLKIILMLIRLCDHNSHDNTMR